MQLTKYDHACLLVDNGSQRLLIDPGMYTNLPPDLASVQTVIVSDEHFDHFDIANLRRVLQQNPRAEILATKTVAEALAKEGIEAEAVSGQRTTNGSGFDIDLVEVDHAPVYGPSPCKVLTIGLGDFLYYPSDSFVSSQKDYLVLALPVGGPWYHMTPAIDLAKGMPTKYVVPTHNAHLSPAGNDSHNRFVGANLGDKRELVVLEPGQSRQF